MAAFPLRVVYVNKERAHGEVPVQILISVPKKRFKHAVDRNRVKRQVREAYRLHKQVLYYGCQEGRETLKDHPIRRARDLKPVQFVVAHLKTPFYFM